MKCLSEQKYAISFIFIKKKSTVNAQVERCFWRPRQLLLYAYSISYAQSCLYIYADFKILGGWMPFRLKKIWAKDYIWSQIQTFFDINTIKFGRLS